MMKLTEIQKQRLVKAIKYLALAVIIQIKNHRILQCQKELGIASSPTSHSQ